MRRSGIQAAGVIGVLAIATSVASAATSTTSSTLAETNTSRAYANTDVVYGGWYGPRVDVAGLSKFDSSLGTLTGIKLTAAFDYTWDLSLTAGSAGTPTAGSQAQVQFTDIRFLVGYRPETTTTTLANNIIPAETLVVNTAGGTDTRSGSGSLSVASVDITNIVNLADFIGAGDVTSLITSAYLPYSGTFTLTNLDGATAASSSTRSAGTISLEYTYAIPEPGTLSILGAGLAFLRRSRRA